MRFVFALLFLLGGFVAAVNPLSTPQLCSFPYDCATLVPQEQVASIAAGCLTGEISDDRCDCICYSGQETVVPPPCYRPEEISSYLTFHASRSNAVFDSIDDRLSLKVVPVSGQALFGEAVIKRNKGTEDQPVYENLPSSCFKLVQSSIPQGNLEARRLALQYNPLCQACGGSYDLLFEVSFAGVAGVDPSKKWKVCVPMDIPCEADVTLVTVGNKIDKEKVWRQKNFEAAITEYLDLGLSTKHQKTARYVELDSSAAQSSFGYNFPEDASMRNAVDSAKFVTPLRKILEKTDSKYLMILGGVSVVPMPYRLDVPSQRESREFFESTDGTIPSDDPYAQVAGGEPPSLTVSRLPTLRFAPDQKKASPEPIIAMLEAAEEASTIPLSQVLLIGDECGSSNPDACLLKPLVEQLSSSMFGKACGQDSRCRLAPTFCQYYQDQLEGVYCLNSPECDDYRESVESGKCKTVESPGSVGIVCPCKQEAGDVTAPASCRFHPFGSATVSNTVCRQNSAAADVSQAPGIVLIAHGDGTSFVALKRKPGSTALERGHTVLITYQFYGSGGYVTQNLLFDNFPAFFSNSCYNGAIDEDAYGHSATDGRTSLVLTVAQAGARAIIGRTRVGYAEDELYFDLINNFFSSGSKNLGERFLEIKKKGYQNWAGQKEKLERIRSELAKLDAKIEKVEAAFARVIVVPPLAELKQLFGKTRKDKSLPDYSGCLSKKALGFLPTDAKAEEAAKCIKPILEAYHEELAQKRDAKNTGKEELLDEPQTHRFVNIEALTLYGDPFQTAS